MKAQFHRKDGGFTLVEMLVAFGISSILLVMLMSAFEPVSNAWINGERRIDTHQRARGALELMARELTPAVVDTRMQFIMMPGDELTTVGAKNVALNSTAMVWMAPIGDNSGLRCVGYYLYRDDEKQFYRLKRIYVHPEENEHYYPRLTNLGNARDLSMRTDPTSAEWFLRNWNETAFDEEDPRNDDVIVSSAADGIIALWLQPYDMLGNPIPWVKNSEVHPESNLVYNSAAYFHAATTEPFDNGQSFSYLAETDHVMKGNRVPAEIEITLITIDKVSMDREEDLPQMTITFDDNGAQDVEDSIKKFQEELEKRNILRTEIFTTRVKLLNGSS